jgi:hypothetical protein
MWSEDTSTLRGRNRGGGFGSGPERPRCAVPFRPWSSAGWRRSGLLHRSSDIVIRVTPDTPTFAAVDGSVNRDFVKLPTSRCTFSALGYRQRIRLEVSHHVCAQVVPGSDGNQGLAFKRDNSGASSNTHLHVPPFFGCLAVLFGCKLSLQVASLKGSYFSTKRLKLDSGPVGQHIRKQLNFDVTDSPSVCRWRFL